MMFDTDVFIWHLRGNARASKALDNADGVQLSIISYMELLQGARNKQELKQIKHLLNAMNSEILPVNENISHRAATLFEDFALSSGVTINDALVAATALDGGLPLCTANARHFREIKGLEIVIFRP